MIDSNSRPAQINVVLCPFCNYKLTPCGEPDFECFQCQNLTSVESLYFVLKTKGEDPHNHYSGTVYDEICGIRFSINDYVVSYDWGFGRPIMFIENLSSDNNKLVYSTNWDKNNYPLTPQNVEKRLPFYLVYS